MNSFICFELRSDGLTCSTVLSLKPKPSFSRQVMYVISMQRKGLMARYLVILLHTANTKSNGFHTQLIIKWFDTWRHLVASFHGLKNSLSNPGATWLKDDFSSLCGWISREVWGEELRVSTGLQVGGGSNGSVHCECVSLCSTHRWCVAVRCPPAWTRQTDRQTDIPSRAASPAWARLLPQDHVTVFSQHKQPYVTNQLGPACNKSGSTWILRMSHTGVDKQAKNDPQNIISK